MKRVRVIPVLLIHRGGLVKSVKFSRYQYIGDPINAVKIFNDKQVDEIAVIDIDASRENRGPDMRKIEELSSEAFMPIAYGGGISSLDQIKDIFYKGIEKVILNRSAVENPELITKAARLFGSQSITVSIDVKRHFFGGMKVCTDNGKKNTGLRPSEFAKRMEDAGAGEILLNAVDRDGTFAGYEISLLASVSGAVSIPVIACGGCGSLADFRSAIKEGGASAVAAGSYFVFQRPHKAVLITYPSQEDLKKEIYSQI